MNGEYGTVKAAWDTILIPFTADLFDTTTQVGGLDRATVVNNGNVTVTFTLRNKAGANSFFYHVLPDSPLSWGPMHSITQAFTWTEPINVRGK